MRRLKSKTRDARRVVSWPWVFFFFQAEDGIRDLTVTGVQTCALPICDGEFRTRGARPPRLHLGENPQRQPARRDGLDQGLRLERPVRRFQGLRKRDRKSVV